jgi:SagB-type dehydrogenase family enzyme
MAVMAKKRTSADDASAPRGSRRNSRIALSRPRRAGVPVEQALDQRRSVRDFTSDTLSLEQVSQLLWACQGVTSEDGKRTAPSAGALYPLTIWLIARRITSVPEGVYRYDPRAEGLQTLKPGNFAGSAAEAAFGQRWIAGAPAILAITAAISRTAARYGSRAERYVFMEAGHAAQNVYLQVQSLGLGTVIVGAFDDAAVANILSLPSGETPVALLPVGWPEAVAV